jgi:hypothetical protein
MTDRASPTAAANFDSGTLAAYICCTRATTVAAGRARPYTFCARARNEERARSCPLPGERFGV